MPPHLASPPSGGEEYDSRAGQRPALPKKTLEQLAQFRLENLAVVVLGQRLDELVVLRPLEAGDVVEAELVEFGGLQRLALARHDEGHHLLAPLGVRAADHRAFG